MRDIVFYDFDFNRLADFNKFISFNIEKKYCGYGSAEIHYSLANSEVLTLLEENPYMFFVAGEHSAIVTGWRVGEDIAIFGRTPEWLLTKRGVREMSFESETPENIVRSIISAEAGDFVTPGDEVGLGTAEKYLTNKVRVLYDVVCEVLGGQSLGFKLVPDINLKQFVFSAYQGKESLCMISQSSRTAYDMTYTVEKQDMATKSGWYEQKYTDMGGWDAYNNLPHLENEQVSNAYTFYEITSETYYQNGSKYYPVERFGLNCSKGSYLYCDSKSGVWKITKERPDTVWVYLDDSKETGAKKWDAVLLGTKTEEEAFAEISRLKRSNETGCETKSIVYGEDYKLGDIVKVQTEFGDFKRAEKKRVEAVRIYYDVDKAGVSPVLKSLEE